MLFLSNRYASTRSVVRIILGIVSYFILNLLSLKIDDGII
nr:MAG TPA_asm: hypothetical protein [Caudoviricetes sp.]